MMNSFSNKLLVIGLVFAALAIPFNSLFAVVDDESTLKTFKVIGYTADSNDSYQK